MSNRRQPRDAPGTAPALPYLSSGRSVRAAPPDLPEAYGVRLADAPGNGGASGQSMPRRRNPRGHRLGRAYRDAACPPRQPEEAERVFQAIVVSALLVAAFARFGPRLADAVHPRVATCLLVLGALASTALVLGTLGMLGATAVAQLPFVADLGDWNTTTLRESDPVPVWLAAVSAGLLTAAGALVVRHTVHRARGYLRLRRSCRTLRRDTSVSLSVGNVVVVDATLPAAFADPGGRRADSGDQWVDGPALRTGPTRAARPRGGAPEVPVLLVGTRQRPVCRGQPVAARGRPIGTARCRALGRRVRRRDRG